MIGVAIILDGMITIIKKSNGRPVVLYLAGPYSGDITANIANARRVQIDLCEHGYFVFNPCNNTANFGIDCRMDESFYLEGDIEMMQRCDVLVLRPDWEQSAGARKEVGLWHSLHRPVIVYENTFEFYVALRQIVAYL